jgi:hypothetical protein
MARLIKTILDQSNECLVAMRRRVRGVLSAFDLRDVFVFSGLACLSYGLGQMYQPLGWIGAGAGLFWLGVRRA